MIVVDNETLKGEESYEQKEANVKERVARCLLTEVLSHFSILCFSLLSFTLHFLGLLFLAIIVFGTALLLHFIFFFAIVVVFFFAIVVVLLFRLLLLKIFSFSLRVLSLLFLTMFVGVVDASIALLLRFLFFFFFLILPPVAPPQYYRCRLCIPCNLFSDPGSAMKIKTEKES